jgi:hypothetical protein
MPGPFTPRSPAVSPNPQAVSHDMVDGAPVTVRYDTGHKPRPPQATGHILTCPIYGGL